MPLKKESILECLNWEHVDVGTVLLLVCMEGIEPGEWSDEEKCAVVGSIDSEAGYETHYHRVDVANTFGAIREAELRHRAKAEVAPTPFPETLHLSEFCDLAQALTERFLIKAASPIDACEALLLAICLEHTHLTSVGEAQNVLVVLSEIMGCDELNGADQIVFENLARCQVAVAKQVGALSVQKGGA